jgi:hypothetical protein
METSVVMFGPEFRSLLVSLAIFGLVAGVIVRSFPDGGTHQLLARRMLGVLAVVLSAYDFFSFGIGAWGSVVETAIEFTLCAYLFAVAAEKRFVPFTEIWSGPPPQPGTQKKKRHEF